MSTTFVNAELETKPQLAPSQCSTKAEEPLANPTAQTLFVAGAVTPVRALPSRSFGLETTLQLVPFQCSIKVLKDVPTARLPMAHTSVLAAPATPLKVAFIVGVGTTLQLVPLKCSASVCVSPLALGMSPTAHMSPAARAAAAVRVALLINGLGTTWRRV
jgi:hypothetical protein